MKLIAISVVLVPLTLLLTKVSPPTTSPSTFSTIQVPSGGDLLATTAVLHLELPGDFFAPGSQPFAGNVAATGAKLGTAGPYEVGTTSLVVVRPTDMELTWPPSGSVEQAIQVSDFAIEGNAPITILVGGTTQTWTVSAGLSQATGSNGSYEFTPTSATEGNFAASVPLPLIVTFKRGTETRTFDLGVVTLACTSNQGTWTTIGQSSTAALAVTGLPLGLALTATLSCPALDLSISPAGVDSGRPGPAYVDPTATIDPEVGSLGRYCSIGAGATIGSGAVIGAGAIIGDNVQINSDVIIGDSASIGAGTVVGSGAYIDSGVVISSGCSIGQLSVVEMAANIGSSSTVGSGAVIGSYSVIRSNNTVGMNARLGERIQTGASVEILEGLVLAPRTRIAASTTQSEDTVTFYFEDGTSEVRTLPVSTWTVPPWGAVHGEDGLPSPDSSQIDLFSSMGEEVGSGNTPPGWGLLPGHIGSDIAPPHCGGTGQPYVKGQYMCSWFAEELRKKLEALGYTTSFTSVWYKNPAWRWWKGRFVKKWAKAHTYTDIHWPNGAITWLEAQYAGGAAIISLDKDVPPDGVTYYNGGIGSDTTEGDTMICVFPNRAAAEAAVGAPFPGN